MNIFERRLIITIILRLQITSMLIKDGKILCGKPYWKLFLKDEKEVSTIVMLTSI